MNVRELLDILKDYPPDTEIELAIVAPVEDDDQISVDRYQVDGVLPWDDDEESEGTVIWLVGGEEDDVDSFLDAVDTEDEPDHEH
jgi:hypothetical protein